MFDVYAKETCHCNLIYDDGKYPNFTQGPPAAREDCRSKLSRRRPKHADSAAVFKHSVTWFILLNLVYNKYREQVGFGLFVLAALVQTHSWLIRAGMFVTGFSPSPIYILYREQ